MFRKLVAIALFVSSLAMVTSGMMMFIIEKPSFTIQMHPVHKLFGLLMVISIICHIFFNYRVLLKHLKTKSVSAFGGVLVVLLFVLYGVALNNQLPAKIAKPMDALASQSESRH